jgi:hypothetical protein
LYLGIQDSSTSDGANAVQGGCASSATQTWHIQATTIIDGFEGWQLQNNVGLCLGVTGGSTVSGARVVQGNCQPTSDHSQFWRPDRPTNNSFQNGHSGLCMGIQGSIGAQVVQGNCTASSSTQKWTIF